jgi:hypothetical protein
VASGNQLRILSGHTETVNRVAFSPDGKMVLTSSQGNRPRLWHTDHRDFVTYACTLVYRDFSNEERRQFSVNDKEATCPQFANADQPMTTLMPPTTTPLATLTLPTWTPIASPTITGTSTPTFTPYPILPSVRKGQARVGSNRGSVGFGGGDLWTYTGKAGEILIIRIKADKPANDTGHEERLARGLFDPRAFVYAPDGKELVRVDDIVAAQITDELIEGLVLSVDGIYQIEIRASEEITSGEYTLIIESSRANGGTPIATMTPTATPAP